MADTIKTKKDGLVSLVTEKVSEKLDYKKREINKISDGEILEFADNLYEMNGNSLNAEQYVEILRNSGLLDEDIRRLLSLEMTYEDLVIEIMNDDNTERLSRILKNQYLINIINSSDSELLNDINNIDDLETQINTIQEQLDNLITEKSKIEQEIQMIKSQSNTASGASIIDSRYKDRLEELNNILSEFKAKNDNIIDSLKANLTQFVAVKDAIDSYAYEQTEFLIPYQSKSDFDDNKMYIEPNISIDQIKQNFRDRIADYNSSQNYSNSTASGYVFNGEIKSVKIFDAEEEALVLYDLLNGKVNHEGNIIKANGDSYGIISDDELIQYYSKWCDGDDKHDIITSEELEVFNYIYNTQGAQAAIDYLDKLKTVVDQRFIYYEKIKDAEWAKENPFLASIGSIFVTPIEGVGAAINSLSYLYRQDKILRTDVYSKGDVWRAAVGEDIAEQYGDVASFIYNTGMSMTDTSLLIGVGALTGGAGMAVISPTLMGSRAYVSTLNDGLDRGLSDGSAVILALSSAFVESLMEGYSAGHLLNLETILKKGTSGLTAKIASIGGETETKAFYIISGALSQGLCEGEEEFATEILNHVLDEYISGDLSSYRLAIKDYVSQGYSIEEATSMASWDYAGQLCQAFLGGFASGFCFGSFSSIKTTNKVSKGIADNIVLDYNGKAKAFADGIEADRVLSEAYESLFEEYKRNRLNETFSNLKESILSLKHGVNETEISISESTRKIANNIKEVFFSRESLQNLENLFIGERSQAGFFNLRDLFKKKNSSQTNNVSSNASVIAQPHKPVSYESVSSYMSRETFDYLHNLYVSEARVAISHVSSQYIQSIFDKGLILNGKGLANGMDDIDYGKCLELQDKTAKSTGQFSYLDDMKRMGYSLNSIGFFNYLNDNFSNEGFSKALHSVRQYRSIDLESAMYLDFYSEEDFFRRIKDASYGISEGGNQVDGVIVIKLPNNSPLYVDKNSELVEFKDGIMTLKPKYIQGYIPVFQNGQIGTVQMLSNINSKKVEQSVSSVDSFAQKSKLVANMKNIIESTMQSLGLDRAGGIKQVEEYLKTGKDNLISSKNGARDAIRSMSYEEIRTSLDLYTGNITPETMRIVFDTIDSWGLEHGTSNYADRIVSYIETKGVESLLGNIPSENNARYIISALSPEEVVNAYDAYLLRQNSVKRDVVSEQHSKSELINDEVVSAGTTVSGNDDVAVADNSNLESLKKENIIILDERNDLGGTSLIGYVLNKLNGKKGFLKETGCMLGIEHEDINESISTQILRKLGLFAANNDYVILEDGKRGWISYDLLRDNEIAIDFNFEIPNIDNSNPEQIVDAYISEFDRVLDELRMDLSTKERLKTEIIEVIITDIILDNYDFKGDNIQISYNPETKEFGHVMCFDYGVALNKEALQKNGIFMDVESSKILEYLFKNYGIYTSNIVEKINQGISFEYLSELFDDVNLENKAKYINQILSNVDEMNSILSYVNVTKLSIEDIFMKEFSFMNNLISDENKMNELISSLVQAGVDESKIDSILQSFGIQNSFNDNTGDMLSESIARFNFIHSDLFEILASRSQLSDSEKNIIALKLLNAGSDESLISKILSDSNLGIFDPYSGVPFAKKIAELNQPDNSVQVNSELNTDNVLEEIVPEQTHATVQEEYLQEFSFIDKINPDERELFIDSLIQAGIDEVKIKTLLESFGIQNSFNDNTGDMLSESIARFNFIHSDLFETLTSRSQLSDSEKNIIALKLLNAGSDESFISKLLSDNNLGIFDPDSGVPFAKKIAELNRNETDLTISETLLEEYTAIETDLNQKIKDIDEQINQTSKELEIAQINLDLVESTLEEANVQSVQELTEWQKEIIQKKRDDESRRYSLTLDDLESKFSELQESVKGKLDMDSATTYPLEELCSDIKSITSDSVAKTLDDEMETFYDYIANFIETSLDIRINGINEFNIGNNKKILQSIFSSLNGEKSEFYSKINSILDEYATRVSKVDEEEVLKQLSWLQNDIDKQISKEFRESVKQLSEKLAARFKGFHDLNPNFLARLKGNISDYMEIVLRNINSSSQEQVNLIISRQKMAQRRLDITEREIAAERRKKLLNAVTEFFEGDSGLLYHVSDSIKDTLVVRNNYNALVEYFYDLAEAGVDFNNLSSSQNEEVDALFEGLIRSLEEEKAERFNSMYEQATLENSEFDKKRADGEITKKVNQEIIDDARKNVSVAKNNLESLATEENEIKIQLEQVREKIIDIKKKSEALTGELAERNTELQSKQERLDSVVQVMEKIRNEIIDTQKLNSSAVSQPKGGVIDDGLLEQVYSSLNDYNSLKSILDNIKSYTDDTVPYGFESAEDYKRTFIRTLIDSGKINGLRNGQCLYELTTDSIFLSELIGNEKLNRLIVNNISSKGPVSKLVINSLSKLTYEDFNRLFSESDIKSLFDSMQIDDLKLVLNSFSVTGLAFLQNETIINKLLSLTDDELLSIFKNINFTSSEFRNFYGVLDDSSSYYHLLNEMKDRLLNDNYFYDHLSDIQSLNGSLYYTFFDNADENVTQFVDAIRAMKNKLNDKIVDISNGLIYVSHTGSLYFNEDSYDSDVKYYSFSYIIDGQTYTKEVTLNSYGISFALSDDMISALYKGKLTDLKLVPNNVKNNAEIDSSMGLERGLNEVKVVVDGVEQDIIIYNYGDSFNVYNFFPDARSLEIGSVKPLDSFNVDGLTGGKFTEIIFETDSGSVIKYGVVDESGILNIDDIIRSHNIVGVKSVQKVLELNLSDVISKISDINVYKSSSQIFSDESYGGNQSDVPNYLLQFLDKSGDAIIIKKGQILDNLLSSYFENIDDVDKVKLARHYEEGGCAYMAIANAFATYMGSIENGAQIFKDKFGYDLYVVDGDKISYNVEAIAFEMYLNLFSSKYGNSVLDIINSGSAGLSEGKYTECFELFENHNIKVDCKSYLYDSISKEYMSNTENARRILLLRMLQDNSMFHILTAADFSMNLFGNDSKTTSANDGALANVIINGNLKEHVGGHAMTITGVDGDGDLIVSSWSEKYKIPISEVVANYNNGNENARISVKNIAFSILDEVL